MNYYDNAKELSNASVVDLYVLDEFAVVLNSSANLDKLNAVFVAEQNKAKIQSRENLFPTISVGHELFNPEYDDIRDVIKKADHNMYEAKMRKKGTI